MRLFCPALRPLCHHSCRLDSSVILGALRNDSGLIRQRIQRTDGDATATARECGSVPGVPGDWSVGGDIGTVACGGAVQARSRAGLDSRDAPGGGDRHGGDGPDAAQRLVPREKGFPVGPRPVARERDGRSSQRRGMAEVRMRRLSHFSTKVWTPVIVI